MSLGAAAAMEFQGPRVWEQVPVQREGAAEFICGSKPQDPAEAGLSTALNGVRRSWSALINWDAALCGGRKTSLPHLIAGRKEGRKGELIRFIKH